MPCWDEPLPASRHRGAQGKCGASHLGTVTRRCERSWGQKVSKIIWEEPGKVLRERAPPTSPQDAPAVALQQEGRQTFVRRQNPGGRRKGRMQPQSSQVSARGGPNQRQGKRERREVVCSAGCLQREQFLQLRFLQGQKKGKWREETVHNGKEAAMKRPCLPGSQQTCRV